ncbi:MAG: hypothetical protein RRY39_07345, partial [Odoribacter sp.]
YSPFHFVIALSSSIKSLYIKELTCPPSRNALFLYSNTESILFSSLYAKDDMHHRAGEWMLIFNFKIKKYAI